MNIYSFCITHKFLNDSTKDIRGYVFGKDEADAKHILREDYNIYGSVYLKKTNIIVKED